MHVHQRPQDESRAITSPTPEERSGWKWQRLAQGVWVVLALILLIIFVANIPFFYQSTQSGCTFSNPAQCPTGLLTSGNVRALERLHLPVPLAANILATLTVAVSVCYWLVGILIFWRTSQDRASLFFSFECVLLAASGIFGFSATAHMPWLLQMLTTGTVFVLNVSGPAFFLVFPTGRFRPRWTWAVLVLFWVSLFPIVPAPLTFLPFLLVVGVQIYRYRRIYNAVQRQQTKWFVFGFGVGLFFFVVYNALGALAPGLSTPDSWYQLFNALPWLLLWLLMLVSISVSILRYRLWDIDVIINRTLVYGSLSILLVALYVGLILALQALVSLVTGNLTQQQPLVLVSSTLVIAALFQPLRRRLQASIDRRFYRSKYDAARVVAAFGATLRQEVDLEELRERLLTVMQETMQPAHASLWIRRPDRSYAFSLKMSNPAVQEVERQKERIEGGL